MHPCCLPLQAGREATQLALLQDAAGEDDWGLEGLEGRGSGGGPGGRRRRSLVDELTEAEEAALEDGLGVGGGGQVRPARVVGEGGGRGSGGGATERGKVLGWLGWGSWAVSR